MSAIFPVYFGGDAGQRCIFNSPLSVLFTVPLASLLTRIMIHLKSCADNKLFFISSGSVTNTQ